MKLGQQAREALIQLANEKGIYLRGDLIAEIEDESDPKFKDYLGKSLSIYEESRKSRMIELEHIKASNEDLIKAQEKNGALMQELQDALSKAEDAKRAAETDLDLLQKKTQFEMIGMIVKVSLAIILGVGLFTTILYIYSIHSGKETTLIGNTWSNMFGILLTNSFSIIGTIMGIKYATGDKAPASNK